MKRLATITIGMLLIFPMALFAQENNNFSINLSGGTNYFHGDINSQWGYQGIGGLKYNISNQFALEGEFRYGLMKGGDDKYDRKFENQFMQYGINGVLNVSKLSSLHVVMPNVAILAKAGIHQINNSSQDLKDYQGGQDPKSDYTGTNLVFPMGGKIKYNLSKRLDLGLGIDYTYSNTDKLDNFAVSEPSNRFNDGYSTYSLGLTIKLGKKSAEHADWDQRSEAVKKVDKLDRKYRQKFRVMTEQIKRLKEEKANKQQMDALIERFDKMEEQKGGVSARRSKNSKSDNSGDGEKMDDKDATKSNDARADKGGDAGVNFKLDNRRFVTVLGSFKSLEKAKNYANEVSKEGYQPGVLYNYYRDWFYVHVNKHENMEKARQARQEVRKDLKVSDAWIYFRSADDLEKYRN